MGQKETVKDQASRPVSRILYPLRAVIIPLAPPLLAGSSDLPESPLPRGGWGWRAGPALLSYLVLLRVGFTLPSRSPGTRCALTAPFHPYPPEGGRYVFCGTCRESHFERDPLAVNQHAALRSPDFPLLACWRAAITRPACPSSYYTPSRILGSGSLVIPSEAKNLLLAATVNAQARRTIGDQTRARRGPVPQGCGPSRAWSLRQPRRPRNRSSC